MANAKFSGACEHFNVVIKKYTTLSIEVVGSDLKQLQIGGRFKAGDIDGLFAALETNFGIEVKRLTYNKIELVEQQAAL